MISGSRDHSRNKGGKGRDRDRKSSNQNGASGGKGAARARIRAEAREAQQQMQLPTEIAAAAVEDPSHTSLESELPLQTSHPSCVDVVLFSLAGERVLGVRALRSCTVLQLRHAMEAAAKIQLAEFDVALGTQLLTDLSAQPFSGVTDSSVSLSLVRRQSAAELDLLYKVVAAEWLCATGRLSIPGPAFAAMPKLKFAEVLAACGGDCRVRQLLLEGCGPAFGDHEADAVAEALRRSTSIEHVSLARNAIGDAGALRLADAVERSTSLRTLWLQSNAVGDVGASRLARAALDSPSLLSVWLQDNATTEVFEASLAQVRRDAKAQGLNVHIRMGSGD